MNKIFNSNLEISLRYLLLLYADNGQGKSLDSIVTTDYIAIYGKYFGISEYNLHGDNELNFAEYVTRRQEAHPVLSSLLLRNLIKVETTSNGFLYSITDLGKKVCESIRSEYQKDYLYMVHAAIDYLNYEDEKKIIATITKEATASILRR